MSFADRVLDPILKRVKLPEELIRFTYLLLVREEELGFPSIYVPSFKKREDLTVDDVLIPYTTALHFILDRLPRGVRDLEESGLHANVAILADLKPHELAPLAALEHEYQPTDPKHIRDYYKDRTTDDWVKALSGGMWGKLLSFNLTFSIPAKARYEGTHVIATPGSGKTQLLQKLIYEDLQTNAAVIVMAPKGTLIPNLTSLKAVEPERLVLVRPEDRDHPLALNLFDLGKGNTDSIVGIVNYVLSSILDAGTTSKQTALLNYCTRLMLAVPGATVVTLRNLMQAKELPEEYAPYVEQLSETAQEFFERQFPNQKTYGETKEQILWRLDLLLENSIVQGMFSHPKTLINMGEIMASGKVLLIDTSIKHLGSFGSAFLGRFFIALVTLAAQQRDVSKPLRSVWFYVDEASTYLNEFIEEILDRAREAKVGLTLAHQHLAQLRKISPQLEASVLNTSVKIVGRVQDADAREMAREMFIDPMLLQRQEPFHFYLTAKGFRQDAMPIQIKYGFLEDQPMRSPSELAHVVAQNRARYAPARPPKPKKKTTPKPAALPAPVDDDDDIESMNRA